MSTQSSTALSLIRQGLVMQLYGLVYGIVIQEMPFPRLALTAHIQAMGSGGLVLVGGILLYQPSLLDLGPMKCRIISWGFLSAWAVIVASCANAFWGTKEMLPIAAKVAGAEGALVWQEKLVSAAHIIPGLGLICAYGLLLQGALVATGRKKKD